jgi:MFS family permease
MANSIESQTGPDFVAKEPKSTSLKKSLSMVTLAWMFGSAWMYITTGAALTRFAKLLEMPKFGFGLLAAMPFGAALVQLASSYVIERYGHRKRIVLIAGITHRALWLIIAGIPWFVPHAWWWQSLLIAFTLSSLFTHFAAPAWMSWMADLIPSRIRGRYFSRRMQIGQLTGIVVTLVIGYVLDVADVINIDVFQKTISALFVVAGIFGIIDFLCHLPVPEPKGHIPDAGVKFHQLIRKPLADRNFRRFLYYTVTLTFAIGYVGQFVWLYVFDEVGMSNFQANLMLVAVPLTVMAVSYPIWGRLIDRLGRKPVLIIAGVMIIHGAASWIFVTSEKWWFGYLTVMVATFAWPGVELANLNILLGLMESKSGKRQGSIYSAVNSMAISLAGIISGIFGGTIAQLLQGWRTTFFNWPITYHGVLFLISALLRLSALFWVWNLEEPYAFTTRQALRYMWFNIYSNVQQSIFMPARRLGRLGRLARVTYKMNVRRRQTRKGSTEAK